MRAIAEQPRVAKLAEMRRHARLRELGDGDELGDRELLPLEQRHEPHARGLGEELQRADGRGEGRHPRHPSIAI